MLLLLAAAAAGCALSAVLCLLPELLLLKKTHGKKAGMKNNGCFTNLGCGDDVNDTRTDESCTLLHFCVSIVCDIAVSDPV